MPPQSEKVATPSSKSSSRKHQPPGRRDENIVCPQPHTGNWFACVFNQFAKLASRFTGHPLAFCLAMGVIIVWAVSGPIFHYSDTWQLVINTGTTIITFLMVFLIQSTQNRDMAATQIKLDELIRALDGAHNSMLDLEELEEEELEKVRTKYQNLAERSRELLESSRHRSHESPPPKDSQASHD